MVAGCQAEAAPGRLRLPSPTPNSAWDLEAHSRPSLLDVVNARKLATRKHRAGRPWAAATAQRTARHAGGRPRHGAVRKLKTCAAPHPEAVQGPGHEVAAATTARVGSGEPPPDGQQHTCPHFMKAKMRIFAAEPDALWHGLIRTSQASLRQHAGPPSHSLGEVLFIQTFHGWLDEGCRCHGTLASSLRTPSVPLAEAGRLVGASCSDEAQARSANCTSFSMQSWTAMIPKPHRDFSGSCPVLATWGVLALPLPPTMHCS